MAEAKVTGRTPKKGKQSDKRRHHQLHLLLHDGSLLPKHFTLDTQSPELVLRIDGEHIASN